jgi:hypothetical protein
MTTGKARWNPSDVRFGSKADIEARPRDVRDTHCSELSSLIEIKELLHKLPDV